MNSLEDIVARCRKGERNAQKELYALFAGKMKAICYRYLNSYEEAKDITQDGFLKVFDNLHRFDAQKGNLHNWIKTIMINTTLNYLKKKKRLPIDTLEEHHDVGALDAEAMNDSSRDFTAEELEEAIQSLSLSYRIVFQMYVLDDLSHKEIAEALQISEESSRTRLKRSRIRLKEYLHKLRLSKIKSGKMVE
ncbi:MAG: sigma-70 family RNA polymerase sigma factor [Cytophagaceae bacterium]|nr:sigma-70 family RNA polymerase sigma factor [Cytophagaceae bacterium]